MKSGCCIKIIQVFCKLLIIMVGVARGLRQPLAPATKNVSGLHQPPFPATKNAPEIHQPVGALVARTRFLWPGTALHPRNHGLTKGGTAHFLRTLHQTSKIVSDRFGSNGRFHALND